MKLRHLFKTAASGLKAHMGRTILTILGIVIGVMAIILVMALGQGAQALILNQISGFGSRNMSVEPGRQPQGPADIYELFTDSIKDREVNAIKNPANVRGISGVEPFVAASATIVYDNETKRTTIYGGSPLLLDMFGVYPNQGSMFTQDDILQRASVAVIGSGIKQDLFGDSDALGEKIKIKGKTFRVVGILPKKGQVSIMNVDKMVMVPYSTAQKYILGVNYYNGVLVQAVTEDMVPIAKEDIQNTLRELHGITDPAKDDFRVETMQDAADRIKIITDILTLLLASVAAISLLVGGIGIMNIMLVSVTERTKEIGLRKALGATRGDIMTQFLLEAIFLTLIGGLLGIAFGAGFAWIIAFSFQKFGGIAWVFVFPISAVILGVSVSATIGLIFGLYPAGQAAKKSPIEALRYE